jgi:ribose 5-phosphate isomerase B
MRIAIGADHAGYELKDTFVKMLRDEGHLVTDFGTCGPAPVDYPDYAKAVGEAIQNGEAERGVLICGSGAGVAVAANKMKGIRAAVCHDAYTAHQCVEHDNANVMCMGPRVIGPSLAEDLLDAFLKAKFTGEERHVRRLAKIDEIERMEANS